MGNVSSLNIEYFFIRIYSLVTGIDIEYLQIPFWTVSLIQGVAILGIVVSVLLLVLTIHIRIRTHQVEHEGFHALEAESHAAVPHEQAAKNPRWEAVEILAGSPNESDWRRAILEADIILGLLLTERGYVGASIGEQLKNANPLQFTTIDSAWEAHRMRNALAHLGEAFPLSDRDTRATVEQYRRVFEEFGYI